MTPREPERPADDAESSTVSGVSPDAATLGGEGATEASEAATVRREPASTFGDTGVSPEPEAKTLGPEGAPTLKTPRHGAHPRTPTPGLKTPGVRTPGRAGSGSGGTWQEGGPAVDFAGGRFGRYRLEGELGRGGMGVVYRAREVDLNRTVALKVMLAGTFADEEERKRFLREAKAAAILNHPHIVGVHDYGAIEGNAYFTMDFVEGEALSAKIPKEGMPVAEVVRLMTKVADAVGYAHLRGIIHRDLKPANIMIDKQGEPRLLDFGLAKKVGAGAQTHAGLEKSLSKTVEGALLGTPYYMAPEQASGSVGEIDTRSDVWALGVMLFEMLSGERPFQGASIHDILAKIIEGDAPSIRQKKRSVDVELEGIVTRCLEREKNRRYATGHDLAEDLGRYARGEAVSARRVSPLYRFGKRIRRHKGLSATIVAAVLAVASVITWVEVSRRAEAEVKLAGGRDALGKHEYEAARDLFREALAIRPGLVEAVEGRATAIAAIDLARQRADEERERRERQRVAEAETRARAEQEAEAARRRAEDVERKTAEGRRLLDEAMRALGGERAPGEAERPALRQSLIQAERHFAGALFIAPTHTAAARGRFESHAALAGLELSAGAFGAAQIMAEYARSTGVDDAASAALARKIAAAEAAARGLAGTIEEARGRLGEGKLEEARGLIEKAALAAKELGADDRGEIAALRRRLDYARSRAAGIEARAAGRGEDAIALFLRAKGSTDSEVEKSELDALARAAAEVEIGRLLKRAQDAAMAGDAKTAIATVKVAEDIGRGVGEGHDPRPEAMRLLLEGNVSAPEGFAYVAAGPFLAGSDEKPDRNPRHEVTSLPAFYIALREVSNGEYAAFVEAGGYAAPALEKHWLEDARALRASFVDRRGRPGPSAWSDGRPVPELAAQPGADFRELPVTGISLYEARAYADWRGGARLPTDDEWEKAASLETGGTGKRRAFPWGDGSPEDARVRETLGGFPARGFVEVWNAREDKSPVGCLLMGGNVHEWCSSADGRPVLRGGGARLPFAAEARATHRFLPVRPTFRGRGTGVRLAMDALR